MKIILIGENSFLGQSLRQQWENKFELRSLSRSEYDFPSKSFQFGFDWNLLKESDVIIHCVAAGVQRGHQFTKDELYQINCLEPIHLMQGLHDADFQGKLITFGSYFSLGFTDGKATESDFFKCENLLDNDYSLSKFLFSCYSNRAELPINHTHLILSNIFGPLEHVDRLIPYIHSNVRQGRQMSFSHGNQIRQFTFVNDLIQSLELVINSPAHGIFHLTNPDTKTVREIVMQALEVFGEHYHKTPDYVFGNKNLGDANINRLALDPNAFLNTFGKVEFTSLKEAFSSYLEND